MLSEDGGRKVLRNVVILCITTWRHNMKMEAARSSETLVSYCITTWCQPRRPLFESSPWNAEVSLV